MFSALDMAPPDAILGLTEAFKKDPNPAKINLSVGVYKDAKGQTPVLATVKKAEERLLAEEKTKGYLGIDGSPAFAAATQELLLGAGHEALVSRRIATAQTPGGTGALRVAADFLAKKFPKAAVWLSKPTWPNHPSIFQAAGLTVKEYAYFDPASNSLDFTAMLASLDQVGEGDVVLLHACCHNPTGVDPAPEQWKVIADKLAARKALPFFDFAYQGFGDGLEEDAVGLRIFCRPGAELLVASSFSKNFGLYNERVGALTLLGANEEAAQKALSHVKTCIRANYSNPPSHGGAIVTTILKDPALRAEWEKEVAGMRDRINGMRKLFVETLKAKGIKRDFSFIARQRGMFSFSGLTPEHVKTLRDTYAIYIVGSGRINVAGMTEDNMGQLCEAIKNVL